MQFFAQRRGFKSKMVSKLSKSSNHTIFQIHLHDQGEVPEMKDQGFAVASGTHTLVGIKRFEVKFLFYPIDF